MTTTEACATIGAALARRLGAIGTTPNRIGGIDIELPDGRGTTWVQAYADDGWIVLRRIVVARKGRGTGALICSTLACIAAEQGMRLVAVDVMNDGFFRKIGWTRSQPFWSEDDWIPTDAQPTGTPTP